MAYSTRRGDYRIDAGASVDNSRVDYAQYQQEASMTPSREVIGDAGAETELFSAVSGKSRIHGAYLSTNVTLPARVWLTASARYNRARVTNTLRTDEGPQPTEGFTYTRLNPSLGLSHQFNADATVYANIAQSNRVPTVIELGCANPADPCRLPVGLQSDPYLKQVVARAIEAGIRGRLTGTGGAGSYALSLHRTVNHDDILFLSAPSRQGYFANFDRTRYQGLDAALDRQAGRLGMRFAYSYLQAVYDADGDLFTGARNVVVRRGTPIAGLPRHTGKFELDWAASPQLNVGAELHALSPLVTQGNEDGLVDDPEHGNAARRADLRIPGYALVTLRASYRFGARTEGGWALFARITNVFDRRYETYGALAPDLFPHGQLIKPHEEEGDAENARFVAPGAPRTVVAGLRYAF